MTQEQLVERKTHHLEMIQGVINRMAQNSFMLKGWALTLAAALFALAAEGGSPYMVAVAIVPTAFFWYLDGFFLHQERLFRALYDDVAEDVRNPQRNEVPLYDMKRTKYVKSVQSVVRIMFSRTVWPFFLSLIVAEAVAAVVLLKLDILALVRVALC